MHLKRFLGGNGDVECLMKNLKYMYRFDDYLSKFLELPNLEVSMNYNSSESGQGVSTVLICEKDKPDKRKIMINSNGVFFRFEKGFEWKAISTGSKLDYFDNFVAKGTDKLCAVLNVV